MIEALALAALGSALFAERGELTPAGKRELARRAIHGPEWTIYYTSYDSGPISDTFRAKTVVGAFDKLRKMMREQGDDPTDDEWRLYAVVRGGQVLDLDASHVRDAPVKGQGALKGKLRILMVNDRQPMVVEFDFSDDSVWTRKYSPWSSGSTMNDPNSVRAIINKPLPKWRGTLVWLKGAAKKVARERWGRPQKSYRSESEVMGAPILGGTLVYVAETNERLF